MQKVSLCVTTCIFSAAIGNSVNIQCFPKNTLDFVLVKTILFYALSNRAIFYKGIF